MTSSTEKIMKAKCIIAKLKGRTALEHYEGDPFVVLISTILSQRTRDENTIRATNRLFAEYKTPAELASAPLKKVKLLIKPSGFYITKAKRIKEVARIIAEKCKGKVPSNLQALLDLPGVGRKTANCVLVYGFKKSAIPVDTHVHRISNRLGLVRTKTPEQTEEELRKTVPRKYWLDINELFVKFGQQVCLPRNPCCGECSLTQDCEYYESIKQ